MARRASIGVNPLTFQATLPDSGDWLKVNKDDARITLVVPLDVGALLTAATQALADQVLRVVITRGGDEDPH